MADLLQAFFNALPDYAIGGVDVTSTYVNRSPDDAHNPVEKLRQRIKWTPTSDKSYLFTGLRGAGKTTELNRLISLLKQDGIAAFYCDASLYLNLNDPKLALAELLMTALAGLADAVRKEHGQAFLQDSIWDRMKRAMNSNVLLKPTLKVGTDHASVEVEASLQENPDFKKELLTFTQQSNEFYDEAGKFADLVAKEIRRHTGADKIVLVVDSLERLSAPTGEESTMFNSLKELFFNDPTRLRFSSISVIYTAPPYLDVVLPNVSSGFAETFSLPNFKIMTRPQDGTDSERNMVGLEQMVQIVEQRFSRWQEVFSRAVLEELAWMSGGNVRRFFYLVRTTVMQMALGKHSLPLIAIDSEPLNQAISEAARPLQWLTASDRTWLQRFMAHSRNPSQYIENLADDLPPIIRLFDHSLVLNYQNGEAWYQVPPLVRKYVGN
jgi:hypothetical protein